MAGLKKKSIGLLLLPVFFLCVFFVYQGNADTKSSYPVTRVSVILPHSDDGYWNLIAEGIEEAEQEIGEKHKIDISMMMPQLNYNIPQMTDILKQQIAAKVDVIVVQGNEDEEFQAALLDAYHQGIQVICVDTDASEFPEHLYIGTDNYEAGKMLGEKLVELTGGTARIAIVSGEEGYLNLQQRLQGVTDVVQDYPGIEIVDVYYDNYDGLTFMRLYHELGQQADALLCLEGTAGVTLSAVYSEPTEDYRFVLGFDLCTGVKNGVLDGVVKQSNNQMGHKVVEEIANSVETGKYSTESIYTDIRWVTAENYDEVMK